MLPARLSGTPAHGGAELSEAGGTVTVALSRASALVAVVADPALLVAPVRTSEQLMAVDALCRYAAQAGHVAAVEG